MRYANLSASSSILISASACGRRGLRGSRGTGGHRNRDRSGLGLGLRLRDCVGLGSCGLQGGSRLAVCGAGKDRVEREGVRRRRLKLRLRLQIFGIGVKTWFT